MHELKEKLIAVGLSDKEASVYLALLESGKTTAYKLATKASVKISTTYVILEELRKKDLVGKIPNSKRHLFVANDPVYFFDRLLNNVNALEMSLPKIQALSRKKDESGVFLYEGYTGIHDSLNYKMATMKGKTFLGFYSSLPNPDKKLLQVMIDWSNKCVDQSIETQAIAPNNIDSQKWMNKTLNKYTKGLKLVDDKVWSSEISIEVGTDFVRIIDTKELQAVVVDNKKVANAFKQMFRMIWEGVEGNIV